MVDMYLHEIILCTDNIFHYAFCSRVSAGCRTAGCRTVPLGGAASRAERRDRVQRLDACAPGVAAPAALDRSDMFASRPAARERDFSPSLGAACVVASTAWTFGRLDR